MNWTCLLFSFRSMLIPVILVCYANSGMGQSTNSQELELVTDRPDQTESSSVVPLGFIQIEAGWSLAGHGVGGSDLTVHTGPSTLLRVGLTERIELRFDWIGGIWQKEESLAGIRRSSGVGDGSVGAKILMTEETGWFPQSAVIVDLVLPIGSDEFSGYRTNPGLLLAFSHTLSSRLSMGYNVGILADSYRESELDIDTRVLASYSLALGYGFTERLGGFVELFGGTPLSLGGGAQNFFDGGVTFLALSSLQIDFSAGKSLSESASADWFLGAGLSVRLPR